MPSPFASFKNKKKQETSETCGQIIGILLDMFGKMLFLWGSKFWRSLEHFGAKSDAAVFPTWSTPHVDDDEDENFHQEAVQKLSLKMLAELGALDLKSVPYSPQMHQKKTAKHC